MPGCSRQLTFNNLELLISAEWKRRLKVLGTLAVAFLYRCVHYEIVGQIAIAEVRFLMFKTFAIM